MATLKHISSKNSDYTAIEAYLIYQHDSFTGKQLLDMDVSRMVVSIRVSADDGRMTGEVFFAEFQAKCLCLFHGQAEAAGFVRPRYT